MRKAVSYKLRVLYLWSTNLKSIHPNIGNLQNLRELFLHTNQLTHLPEEIFQLVALEKIDLGNNKINSLPVKISRLRKLQHLGVYKNMLTSLPIEVYDLSNLETLNVSSNRINQISSNISLLKNLHILDISDNHLSILPIEIGELRKLQRLHLSNNSLQELLDELWQLVNLQQLSLANTKLSQLPADVGQLTNLQILDLARNKLRQLPQEIIHLTRLQSLDLSHNQLRLLPPELGLLNNLQQINLIGNQLRLLPPEMGHLNKLQQQSHSIGRRRFLSTIPPLALDNNPDLLSPPPEIVARGTKEILAFLRELHESGTTRYESKLLVVGEGGTGKSSLLRAIRGETFDPHFDTTHGIEVGTYKLAHPNEPETEITLNTWDFGGQQIYHATHQFFLTKRSLYVVVWNARLGADQGRLNYWLDTIKALAPDTPVLLVATHTDERAPDLNYQSYKDAYPQLVGNISISNKSGAGIVELRHMLAQHATALPLMGQPWPQMWLDAERTLLARRDHHINADTYARCCASKKVKKDIARGTLGQYLHDLGKILYFRDDDVLCNLIVLKPNWVTKAISRVLTDEAVIARRGILEHSELPRIWATDEDGRRYERHLYPVFLRLMERFDLSYQIEADEPGDHPTRSLVPQLLPHQPPADLPIWPEMPAEDQTQVEMIYRLDFVPAGIMSWFIVRTHRYTRSLHWRDGCMLEYEAHQARVELNPMLRELRLVVRGSQPHNFFTILKNTVDLILDRFEGLRIQREVPCICHWQRGDTKRCARFYRYEDLARRMEVNRQTVECPDTFTEVPVPVLLYGIHISTEAQVLEDIRKGQHEIQSQLGEHLPKLNIILEKVNQQSELIGREFTRLWNLEMQKLEAECPSTFFLMPGDRKPFNPKNWVSQEYTMYLVCQHPPGPHQAHGGGYQLRQSAEWWATVSPWLIPLIKFLRYGVPIGIAGGKIVDEAIDRMAAGADMLERIANSLEQLDLDNLKRATMQARMAEEQQAVGPALRALYSFLKEADPQCIWSGLYKTPTPDGNILWLCDEHRQPYLSRTLVLPDLEPTP